VPSASLCCGRPLYDFGMLDTAKSLLRQILRTLQPQIQASIPIVGLEPSCITVFRDELTNLFPHDKDAQRLHDQTYLLSEFLNKKVKDYQPPRLEGHALVHGHCHHKSVIGMSDEEAILGKAGLDFEQPEKGCCGMAGSFGFESGEKYRVSIAVGEQHLLPAVRASDPGTLIIANGFSCKQQIEQTTGRRVLHLAEVLQQAQKQGQAPGLHDGHNFRRVPVSELALAGAGLALGGLVAWKLLERSRS
jgi:Fe-S oxidoreductase